MRRVPFVLIACAALLAACSSSAESTDSTVTSILAAGFEASPTDEGIFVDVPEGPDAGERANQLPLYSTIVEFPAIP